MTQGKATIVIDLGNSSTKGTVLYGKDTQTGKFREKSFELSNVFAPLDEDYELSSDYNSDTSTILRVNAEIEGQILSGIYCNGVLQEKERPSTTIRPSAVSSKCTLPSTLLSLRLAFLYGFKCIMQLTKQFSFSNMDIIWNVVTLLPPGDIDTDKEKMEDIIRGIDVIDSIFPDASLKVNIDKVLVLPEGFCAYVGCVFDKGTVIRPDYKAIAGSTCLIFDIGAGTTDCVVVKGNTLVQGSKYSIKYGGNNITQYVRRKLKEQGISLDNSLVNKGIIEGYVKDGTKEVDISEYINEGRAEVAQRIISEVQDFLEGSDIGGTRSINYLLACGGGAVESGVGESLGEMLIKNFKLYSPNCELIPTPQQKVRVEHEDDTITFEEKHISPRYLNLVGASILAEVV